MSSNTFGVLFRVTTFGESHGKAIGAVIDGCPPRLALGEGDIQAELDRRKPGGHNASTSRKEEDRVEILSGVFEGETTGTPIALLIRNSDADSGAYDDLREVFRPGHGDFTYIKKYGGRNQRIILMHGNRGAPAFLLLMPACANSIQPDLCTIVCA